MLYTLHPDMVRRATTEELRDAFLLADLFIAGQLTLKVCELDRVVVGAAVPTTSTLDLPCPKAMAATYFCERRELGVINLGGAGEIVVDGTSYPVGNKEALYIGRGSQAVSFSSADATQPAQYYLVSYPAHKAFPTKHVRQSDVTPLELGTTSTANRRRLSKLIVPGVVESCQLVMGITEIADGSVWNTMPPHTHLRRSEVYCYFDIAAGAVVFHFMGEPQQTRHLVMQEKQAVLSPAWSIHSGAGTAAYSFVWAMGGENQKFDDMDGIVIQDLR